jgi:Ca-activated chloride channel family protein
MFPSILSSAVALLSRHLGKPAVFALFGAIGCLIGAAFGEILARSTKSLSTAGPEGVRDVQVCLLMDCSGSMADQNRMEEARQAAAAFVNRANLTNTTIGIVAFSTKAMEVLPPSASPHALVNALAQLQPVEATAMDAGLVSAAQQLQQSAGSSRRSRAVLLFTDGVPADGVNTPEVSAANAISAAKQIRRSGIQIVAVATGDADLDLLAEVTGDRQLVFAATKGDFDVAFQRAEKVLPKPQLIGSGGYYSLPVSLLRNVGWCTFIAAGLSLLLVAGQNAYLRRTLLPPDFSSNILKGAAGAGVAAGLIAQFGLQFIANQPFTTALRDWIHIPAWSVLGAMLGRGIVGVVPNLQRSVAMRGGALGGAVAGVALVLLIRSAGEAPARIVGAAILGAFIGYGIAWMEERAREASLIVRWGPHEASTLSLGSDPVILGSSREAHIYLSADRGFPPVAGVVSFQDGQVAFENRLNAQRYQLRHGSRVQLGNLQFEVCTSR